MSINEVERLAIRYDVVSILEPVAPPAFVRRVTI